MAESIFKNREPGYFGLAEAVIDAIEKGAFVEDYPLDERNGVSNGETLAYIVDRASLPREDQRIYTIAPLMASLFRPQMSDEEYLFGMPREFAFGATRYEGNGCFFFRWPGDREIDIQDMRDKLQEYADMFKEATPEVSALQDRVYQDQISVGPIAYEDFREFDALLKHLISFNLRSTDLRQTPYDDSVVLTFDRQSYLGFFKNEPTHFQPERRQDGGSEPSMFPGGRA